MAAQPNKEQLAHLQKWLLSYGPAKLFTESGNAIDSTKHIIPPEHKNLSQRAETYKIHEPLKVPNSTDYGVEKGKEASCMKTIGDFIDQALVDNPKSLRLLSPDELLSNKLDAVFKHIPDAIFNGMNSLTPKEDESLKSSANTHGKDSSRQPPTAKPAAPSRNPAAHDSELAPDVILVGIGSELTFEVVAAMVSGPAGAHRQQHGSDDSQSRECAPA
ncbi:hypothetical protein EYC80_010021 [Monilinia laxa]|uniref:Uncharacterized protein n=1 Tax=Monilinia laxa TaxID=61186 RepID=A0A5N6JS17_MONLA|nr:hypothetical protein EYC80_010021 [Monilinia laxa]